MERKDHPILFSGEMVRAILNGRKTQTRRIVKPQPDEDGICLDLERNQYLDTSERVYRCPYGMPGDRLWVRETHMAFDRGRINYRADYLQDPNGDREHGVVWTPSIHMPRWASRLTLNITGIRVERLQDISDREPQNDCTAEGVFHCGMKLPRYEEWSVSGFRSSEKLMFHRLWDAINGVGSWDSNPWVWVVEFDPIEKNIDEVK